MRILKTAVATALLILTGLPLAPAASARSNYCQYREMQMYSRTSVASDTAAVPVYDFYNRQCNEVSEETEWPTGYTDLRMIPQSANQVKVIFLKFSNDPYIVIHLSGLGLNQDIAAYPAGAFGGCCSQFSTPWINIQPGQVGSITATSNTPFGFYQMCLHTPGASCP